jgi:MFS family permease
VLLSEKAGRRRLFLASASTMLVFMVLVTICSALYATTQSTAAGYAVIIFLFLFFGGYVIGLTPIPILYVNEICPAICGPRAQVFFGYVRRWPYAAISL